MKKKIFFRADGNSEIGLGHVMRSMALADILKDQFEITFFIQGPFEEIKKTLLTVADNVVFLERSPDFKKDVIAFCNYLDGREIVVLDGYNFDTYYQQKIKAKGCKLVCIDDIHNYHFIADAVINHAGGIKKNDYSVAFNTILCLGLKYALLRKPFLEVVEKVKKVQEFNTVFVNMGGADTDNRTIEVVQKIVPFAFIKKINVVIGSAYSHKESVIAFALKHNHIQIYENLNAGEMCSLMAESPIAVCPPSSVSYEYCSVGGLLFVQQTADNQKDILEFLLTSGLAFNFTKWNAIMSEPEMDNIIKQIVTIQKNTFSGDSFKNLKSLFKYLDISGEMTIRKAGINDMMTYFDWANDRDVRRWAINSDPIPIEDHKTWFEKHIINKKTFLYILFLNENAIGQVRFDIKEENIAYIDYSIDKKYRGKGFGRMLLEKAIVYHLSHQNLSAQNKSFSFLGVVKENNIASKKVFHNLHFCDDHEQLIKGEKYEVLKLTC